jgi:hypothetical protein
VTHIGQRVPWQASVQNALGIGGGLPVPDQHKSQ